jgi:hypothetical protein
MKSTIVRTMSLAAPWLLILTISATLACGVNARLTYGVATTSQAAETTTSPGSRPVGGAAAGGDGWVVYGGPNCWLPDPTGRSSCANERPDVHRQEPPAGP